MLGALVSTVILAQAVPVPASATGSATATVPDSGPGPAAAMSPGQAASALAAPPRGPVLTLAAAEQRALAHQPQLSQAKAQTRAADARVEQAFAPLLPQVNANASYARRTTNFVPNTGSVPSNFNVRTSSSWDTRDNFNFGITASQLVYDFGQTTGNYGAAKSSAAAQKENESTVRQNVLFNVRSAYLGAWAQRALIDVAKEALDNQDRHLQQVQGLVRVGNRPEIDLAQVRADRANAELQLINAQGAYETAKAQLNQAMGIEGSTDFDVADDRIPEVPGEGSANDALVGSAVATRPELRNIAKTLESQKKQIRAIKGAYGPTLSVSTGLTEAGPELSNLVWNWNATANVNWALFQGGLTKARVNEAEANEAATRSQDALTRQQIRFEVTQARLGVLQAVAGLAAAKEVEKNARERLRLAEGRYAAGAGSIIEQQDAQLQASTASGQVVQADYNLSQARAQLLKALGRD